ncbi:MAG: 2-dehydro-3-deoxy-6-phosphogalactonate aldolase [Pseudomonadota bacterium]
MILWSDMLRDMPLIAILRGLKPDDAIAIGEALYEGGIIAVEVPLNSPEPLTSIAALRKNFAGKMLVGAGTVLTPGDVGDVESAGGQFIVSPNSDVGVIRTTKAKGLLSLPGFFTASEAFSAISAGADALKLFPADSVTPAYIKALKAVLPPTLPVLAVGGVNENNLAAFLAAGAAGFGLGSGLFKPGDGPEQVRTKARRYVEAFKAARS